MGAREKIEGIDGVTWHSRKVPGWWNTWIQVCHSSSVPWTIYSTSRGPVCFFCKTRELDQIISGFLPAFQLQSPSFTCYKIFRYKNRPILRQVFISFLPGTFPAFQGLVDECLLSIIILIRSQIPKVVILNQGQFYCSSSSSPTPRDLWQCLQTFLLSQLGVILASKG